MGNNENGRSMVEMLGVLAIIGVLSVAGIGGYSMAMNKYRANEILNAASQLKMLAETANQGNGGAISDVTGLTSVAGAKLCANATGEVLYYSPDAKVVEIVRDSEPIPGLLLTNVATEGAVTCS